MGAGEVRRGDLMLVASWIWHAKSSQASLLCALYDCCQLPSKSAALSAAPTSLCLKTVLSNRFQSWVWPTSLWHPATWDVHCYIVYLRAYVFIFHPYQGKIPWFADGDGRFHLFWINICQWYPDALKLHIVEVSRWFFSYTRRNCLANPFPQEPPWLVTPKWTNPPLNHGFWGALYSRKETRSMITHRGVESENLGHPQKRNVSKLNLHAMGAKPAILIGWW